MRLSDENLRGRTVVGADGQAVGEVAALFLDSDGCGIRSLQVKLRDGVRFRARDDSHEKGSGTAFRQSRSRSRCR